MNEYAACLVRIYQVAAVANYIAEHVYTTLTLQLACAAGLSIPVAGTVQHLAGQALS